MPPRKTHRETAALAAELITLRENKGNRPLPEILVIEGRIEEIEAEIIKYHGVEMLEIINKSAKV